MDELENNGIIITQVNEGTNAFGQSQFEEKKVHLLDRLFYCFSGRKWQGLRWKTN